MYYRRSGRPERPHSGPEAAQAARRELKALTDEVGRPGLIGYRDGVPVGWVSLGPREDFAKLRRSPVMKPVGEQPVWSIVCFVVPREYRGQGVAKAMLDGAVACAAKQGVRLLETYPVDTAQPSTGDSIWFGTKSMVDAAGFEEVARRKPARPVMRLRAG